MTELLLATRGTPLAIAQTRLVQRALASIKPQLQCHVVKVITHGDRSVINNQSLIEGAKSLPGQFTSALTDFLKSGHADIAVHSLKDLPISSSQELPIVAILSRGSPHDIIVIHKDVYDGDIIATMKRGIIVGTSSPRRTALLQHYCPKTKIIPIRGSVETRIKLCLNRTVDAIVIAKAGIDRLEIDIDSHELIQFNLPPLVWPIAPGQGAIAIQARNEVDIVDVIRQIDHEKTRIAVSLERQALKALGKSCSVAMGAYACEGLERQWNMHYGYISKNRKWETYVIQGSESECSAVLKSWRLTGKPAGFMENFGFTIDLIEE